jgi:hypothetical protein
MAEDFTGLSVVGVGENNIKQLKPFRQQRMTNKVTDRTPTSSNRRIQSLLGLTEPLLNPVVLYGRQ